MIVIETHRALQQVKFLAFVSAYKELCEFLHDAEFGINDDYKENRLHLTYSPWLEEVWNKIDELDSSLCKGLSISYDEYVGRCREIKKLEALQRLVVKQGRKCGMTFYQSNLTFADIKIKQ